MLESVGAEEKGRLKSVPMSIGIIISWQKLCV